MFFFDADPHTDRYCYRDANCDCDSHCHTFANGYCDGYGYCDRDSYFDPYLNSNCYADSNRDSYGNSNCDCNRGAHAGLPAFPDCWATACQATRRTSTDECASILPNASCAAVLASCGPTTASRTRK